MEIDFCPVDQMAWVRADNQHRAIAEEIILTCVRLELYLNEGGKVVDCNLIIMWEHEIAVGIMRKIG